MIQYAEDVRGGYIGELVKRFESGSKGSLAFSQCGNDWGISCGSYQFTLRWGNCINFLKTYFPTLARNLYFNNIKDFPSPDYPGKEYCSSPEEVKKVWVECYDSVGAGAFFDCEHDCIQKNYYESVLKKIQKIFNPNQYSRAMQECFWSWSVHRGSGGCYNEVSEILKSIGKSNIQDLEPEYLLDLLYDKRYEKSPYNRYKKGISKGNSERETLREYINTPPLPYSGTLPSISKPKEEKPEEDKSFSFKVTHLARAKCTCNVRKNPSVFSDKEYSIGVGCYADVVEVLGNDWLKILHRSENRFVYTYNGGNRYYDVNPTKYFSAGDTVNFVGSVHYTSSFLGATSKYCRGGQATVIKTNMSGRHPYNLRYKANSGCTVNGWVDLCDVRSPSGFEVGDVVELLIGVHYNSSYSNAKPKYCKVGKVRITAFLPNRDHPYHVVWVKGGDSNARGWVDSDSIALV